jgi:hypothetical protein
MSGGGSKQYRLAREPKKIEGAKLVVITDAIATITPSATEKFSTLRTAGFAEVLRGVSFTPGTGVTGH